MEQVRRAGAHVRDAAGLPEVLNACFDAFELIRLIARECDNHVPALFAAFMMTADAAVDGREAVTAVLAAAPADQAACSEAAEAAERIRHLMARDDHDGYVR